MINKFSGDDIFFLKELLIPYKGFNPIAPGPEDTEEELLKQLENLRYICTRTLG